jgi:uncharacterized protein YndB with AHSA1/START domain
VSDELSLTLERTFAAPAERVFEAFTNEEVMRRWWHVRPHWDTPEARVDLRVGGEVRVRMYDPDKDTIYGGRGSYTEIDPPRRLAFTWVWDDVRENDQPVETKIEIDFTETEGATKVRFTHRDLWAEEAVSDHEDGWSGCLDNLALVLESG